MKMGKLVTRNTLFLITVSFGTLLSVFLLLNHINLGTEMKDDLAFAGTTKLTAFICLLIKFTEVTFPTTGRTVKLSTQRNETEKKQF